MADEVRMMQGISVTGRRLRDISGDAWEAFLGANDPPTVFQRGHLL